MIHSRSENIITKIPTVRTDRSLPDGGIRTAVVAITVPVVSCLTVHCKVARSVRLTCAAAGARTWAARQRRARENVRNHKPRARLTCLSMKPQFHFVAVFYFSSRCVSPARYCHRVHCHAARHRSHSTNHHHTYSSHYTGRLPARGAFHSFQHAIMPRCSQSRRNHLGASQWKQG